MTITRMIQRAAIAAAATITLCASAQAENLRLLTSWDMTHAPNIHMVKEFADRVAERTGGKLEITIDGPEVVAPFEQIEPVQAGVFQMLFTHPGYHTSVIWAGYALDASFDPGPEKRREIGLWDAIDEAYRDVGLKLIAMPGTGNGGYQFVLKSDPKEGDMPFDGLKIRGAPAYKPIIESIGGVLVVLPGGETYAALDRGVVDGAAWPVIGFASTKLSEIAKYYVRPTYGSSTYFMLMNLDAWNGLDPELQKAIEEVAAEIERHSIDVFADISAEEVEMMKAAGMKEAKMTDTAAANMKEAFVSVQRATALESGGPATRKVIEIIEENGL